MILKFGVVFLHLGVNNSYVVGLVFLRSGVTGFYVLGLFFYVWWLIILTFGG